jgi:hypothetical protein
MIIFRKHYPRAYDFILLPSPYNLTEARGADRTGFVFSADLTYGGRQTTVYREVRVGPAQYHKQVRFGRVCQP